MSKTPISLRLQRYVISYAPTKYIPVHIDDYEKAMKLQDKFDLPIIPKFYGSK